MFKAFQSSMAAGGPAYHLATYTVLANPYQGIPGGQKVKVLWVPNALQKKWEALLPDDTQGTLAKSRSKDGGLFARDKKRRDAAPNAGQSHTACTAHSVPHTRSVDMSARTTGCICNGCLCMLAVQLSQKSQILA